MQRVRWAQQALAAVADFRRRAGSAERRAITEASEEIDQRLRSDPWDEGEPDSRDRRILFAPPLAVVFKIGADSRTISVLHVRLFRKRTA